jgi:hypothetical protein
MRIPSLLLILTLAACARDAAQPAPVAERNPPTAISRTDWPLPTPSGAAQPDLVLAPDGRLLLSWIEPHTDGHALQFAAFDATRWSEPRGIARGDDWFVNWADTPHLAITADGALWAHWLQRSSAATYSYDVALVRSGDGGATWSAPVLVNDDGTPTEHGFVSLWPAAPDRLGVAWLDGRDTAAGAHAGHDGHAQADAGGMMTLRSAHFDAALQRRDERVLDPSACDCCQTSVVATARGALLAYRDRTASEIRDIFTTRFDGAAWTAPRPAHADHWTMPACPVNGPALAARGSDALLGWYTAAGNVPTLQLARSVDAGDHFSAPVVVDRGDTVQGRVAVALDAGQAWVAWIREDTAGQSLWLARYAPDLSRELERSAVATLTGRGRATGFPQLVVRADGAYLVWTDVVDGKPRLRGARFTAVAAGS